MIRHPSDALGLVWTDEETEAVLKAVDADGSGTVDLGEFVGTVTKRVREVTSEAALDDGFDAFDADRKGFIVLEDVAKAAKRLGDNVTSEELDALMDLGAADLNDDGEKPKLRKSTMRSLLPQSMYASAVTFDARGLPIPDLIGFIDGKLWPICRPGRYQHGPQTSASMASRRRALCSQMVCARPP